MTVRIKHAPPVSRRHAIEGLFLQPARHAFEVGKLHDQNAAIGASCVTVRSQYQFLRRDAKQPARRRQTAWRVQIGRADSAKQQSREARGDSASPPYAPAYPKQRGAKPHGGYPAQRQPHSEHPRLDYEKQERDRGSNPGSRIGGRSHGARHALRTYARKKQQRRYQENNADRPERERPTRWTV